MAEKKYVAELMKAVYENLKSNENDPNKVIRRLGGSDVFCLIPENSQEIKAKHEKALKSAGIDVNLFNQMRISELLAEAAWQVDSLFSHKYQIVFESNRDMVITPKDVNGNLLADQVYGEARTRVIVASVEERG